MQHVAPLAEGGEVRVRVVAGVMIAVGRCQHHLGRAESAELLDRRESADGPALTVTPRSNGRIPPASVAEMVDHPPVRPTADLTDTARPAEADRGRKLWPVDGVEEAVLAPD